MSELFELLVVAPSWLGDGIMLMPALQHYRELHPDHRIHLLCKAGQWRLWSMHSVPDRLLALPSRSRDWLSQASTCRNIQQAVITPHSFRSALLPWLARIPQRRGTTIQFGRRLLLNDPVDLRPFDDRHQQWENACLLLDSAPARLPPPILQPPAEALAQAESWLTPLPRPWLACIPAAARGPSKEWPEARFFAISQRWRAQTGGSVLWLGAAADRERCAALQQAAPERSLSLAGQSDLPQFAALLALSDQVLANDSGGMHLAATVGTPVVALFGITDPDKTGPLHPDALVLQKAGPRSREVPRDSSAARAALEAIDVEEVWAALAARLSA